MIIGMFKNNVESKEDVHQLCKDVQPHFMNR